MADENVPTQNEPTQEPTTTEPNTEPHGDDGIDWKAMARKWEAKSKANNERIKELETKAAKYDEYEASQKSELERAQDSLTKAQADAEDWKTKYEAMQAEQERMASVTQFASQYKVDAGTLARMTGDVEDNAKYLAGIEAARPKYPETRDGGDQKLPAKTLAEALKGVKSTAERIRIREEFNAKNHNR